MQMGFISILCNFLFTSATFLYSLREITGEPLPYSSRSVDYFIEEHTPRAKNHRYNDEPYDDILPNFILPYKLRAYYAIKAPNNTRTEDHFNDKDVLLHVEQEVTNNSDEFLTQYAPQTTAKPEIMEKMDYDYDNVFPNDLQHRKNSKRCERCKCGVHRKRRGNHHIIRNEYPWLAMLTYFGRFYCSGSLVNNLYVISAGHCTRGYQTAQITVRLFEYDQDSPNESPDIIRKISKIIRPKGYNEKTLNNDISLLRLARAVPVYDGLIRPICLPHPKTSFGGEEGILIGWSSTVDEDLSSSMIKKAIVPILSNRRCRNSELGDAVTNKMICASNPLNDGMDSCFGDSGGPLMAMQDGRYRLAGITSWGKGCGNKNVPSVYTRITKFYRWIRKFSTGACWCT